MSFVLRLYKPAQPNRCLSPNPRGSSGNHNGLCFQKIIILQNLIIYMSTPTQPPQPTILDSHHFPCQPNHNICHYHSKPAMLTMIIVIINTKPHDPINNTKPLCWSQISSLRQIESHLPCQLAVT